MSVIIICLVGNWLIGTCVCCLFFKYQWPSIGVDGEAIVFSMTLGWMYWPILLFYYLLHKRFNKSKGQKP